MSLTKVSYSMIIGSPVNVLDYGADPTGNSDSYAAFVGALATGRAIYVPGGTYLLSATLNFPVGDANVRDFYGDGYEETILLFDDVSGISSNNSGATFSNFSVINKAAGPYPANPVEGNIDSALIGIRLFGNNMVMNHVRVQGFGVGVRIDTKFYNTLYNCMVQFNLVGLKNESNFNHSYACYYSEQFNKSIWVLSGSHDFRSCSLEGVVNYDQDNANYPNGGALIGPETLIYPLQTQARPIATFRDCYSEDHNFFANDGMAIDTLYGGSRVRTIAHVPVLLKNIYANPSVNLAAQPTAAGWTTAVGISQTNNTAQVDGNHYYTIFTSAAAVGVVKQISAPFNTLVRGLVIPTSESADYLIYAGVWVNLKSANFTTAFPTMLVDFEDTSGIIFNAENVVRTQTPIDNTLIDEWQYIGFSTAIRNTLSTGNPLAGVRIYLRMGDGPEDHALSNRIMWVANPELRLLFADGGQAIAS